jgi:hypothetical protein
MLSSSPPIGGPADKRDRLPSQTIQVHAAGAGFGRGRAAARGWVGPRWELFQTVAVRLGDWQPEEDDNLFIKILESLHA